MNVLLLNSYGGSLLIAAKQLNLPILGSYEDEAFGIEAQKLNYPDVAYVDRLPWPVQDLGETLVLAHPPCAPFSNMNAARMDPKRVGTSADGFECHRRVMKYALGNGCKALAIESVPGVMRARAEYEAAATERGYRVFFLHLNSISFGVPQWRPRVWIVFTREAKLGLTWQPVYKPLREVLRTEGTALDGGTETHIMIRRLREAGLTKEQLRAIFTGAHGSGSLLQIGQRYLKLDKVGNNFAEVREAWHLGGLFAAMMPRLLDEDGWAPTVLGGSAWFVRGRALFMEEYNGIMGFPVDYKWPESFADPRVYLSKGVCPPVAMWVLRQLQHTWEDEVDLVVEDRQGIDLGPTKAEVAAALTGKVPPAVTRRGARPVASLRRVASTEADAQGWLERL